MRKVTIDTAIAAIQKKFHGLASILHIEADGTLDIICKDIRTGNWYEVFSNAEWTKLSISRIKFPEP